MKNTLTYFILCFLLNSTVYAKKDPIPDANTPVQFLQNKGQITDQFGVVRKDIDAKVEANGVVMFVGDGELHYQFYRSQTPIAIGAKVKTQNGVEENNSLNGVFPFRGDRGADSRGTNPEVEIYRMDVKLIGANKNAAVIFEEPTGYYEHYYTAHTGEEGVQAKGYGRVVYKDIYPNIDLVLYTPPAPLKGSDVTNEEPISNIENQTSNIKYDFIVRPGGNPADIRLRYDGATEVKLIEGALVATTPFGTITEAAPYSYAKETGEQVASAYKLAGNHATAGQVELSFETGNYTGTLVIDPALQWATYYGGTLGVSNNQLSIATDIYENVYLCGATTSTNNIATSGAYQVSRADSLDAYVVKFDSSGTRLWATYYGNASGYEAFTSLACDKWGNVYLGGICDSFSKANGLITGGAHQTTYGGDRDDLFLVKFNATGQRLWATLYGGNGDDYYATVACDDAGNVYLGGGTLSTNNIATNGTHRSTISTAHGRDGFIAKFTSGGTRLWGSYYGGSGTNSQDYVLALKPAYGGVLYIGGYTFSTSGITGTGAHQGTIGGAWDGFLARFNSNNGTMAWSTYYGGSSIDELLNIDVYDNGVYISGYSYSSNNIATNGVYGSSLFGGSDAFIAAFSPGGVRLWGSYYGGTSQDLGLGMAISPAAKLYIGGMTGSTSSISTTGAHQASHTGGNQYDGFMAEFTTTGQLGYGSYYGGTGNELYGAYGFGGGDYGPSHTVAVSNAGRVYMAGMTTSSSGIATTNGHQPSAASTAPHAFLTAWDADTVVYIPQRYTDTVWCPGDTVRIVYGTNKNFGGGNNFAVQLSDDTGSFDSPVAIGTRADNDDDTITCVIPMNTPAGTGYRIRITGSNPMRTSWDNQWDIRINPLPNLVAGSNSPVCTGDSLKLIGSSSNSGITWLWTGPNGFSSNAKDSFIANAQLIDSGKYILKATLNSTGCSLMDTTTVEMRPTPAKPTAGSNSPVCEFYSLQLTTGSSTNGVSYSWSGPGSYSSTTQNPTVTTSASSTHAGDYISTVTLNGCSSRDTTTVVVLPKPAKPTAGASNSPLCQRQDLQLTASTVTGASYTWYGPSAFIANTQNPVRANIQMGDAGKYYVYATVSGCVSDTDSVVVTINTDPVVNIFPTPGVSICQGKQVIFTAVPTNGGTTSYSWLVNGIATGGTGTTYSTTTLNNGDAVSCAMTSTGTCATPFIDTSNAITMTVQPILSPTVTMTADKMPPWNGGLTVTFTATPTHGGAAPEYQWKRNGQDITGATGATWGVIVNALNANEDICVVLKSSYECAVPDTAMSNCITTAFTGVGDIVNNKNIKIYPNPTSTILHVEGVEAGSTIELIDVLGRKCLTGQLLHSSIDVNNLVPGMYVLRVNGVVAGRVVKE